MLDKHIEKLILRFLKMPDVDRVKFPAIKNAILNMSPLVNNRDSVERVLWKLIDRYTLLVHDDYTLSLRNNSGVVKSRT